MLVRDQAVICGKTVAEQGYAQLYFPLLQTAVRHTCFPGRVKKRFAGITGPGPVKSYISDKHKQICDI